ncbi:MAG: phytoene desaturase family protein [Syntrophotaleaceae bacterium]
MSRKEKHVVVIGAGPGGLSAAMILANRGYRVSIYEREDRVGGRNRTFELGPYSFDLGPTFLMMDFFLREIFLLAGRKIEDYLSLVRLDPMYELNFDKDRLLLTDDHYTMKARLAQMFPGDEEGLDKFLEKEKIKYEKMYPCLRKDYSTLSSMFHKDLLTALPYLDLPKNIFSKLGDYFTDERCRLGFTFQAKYLGMSPWECPAAFTILPYIEHEYGIYHVMGGLGKISTAMAQVIEEHDGQIHLGRKVNRVMVNDRRQARGVELDDGEKVEADAVVINADFGHAMETLFAPGVIRKYSPDKLRRKKYSCSTFMIYLGVNRLYDEEHHQIIFADDYKRNIDDIMSGRPLHEDMSIYVRNASRTDASLAPENHSALYILVPVPNSMSGIVWDAEQTASYRSQVMERITERTSMRDLQDHIVVERIITPADWKNEYHLFEGATFNLGHNIGQMLYFRPHNRFEEVGNCYLVGGGTHPGSGLPTIYESGRITANLIFNDLV